MTKMVKEHLQDTATEQTDEVPESTTRKGKALSNLVAGTTSQHELLTLFIGSNAYKFLGPAGGALVTKKGWSFNWIAALIGLPWFFYRKLYLVGLIILLVPAIITIIIPQLAEVNWGFFSIAFGGIANIIYLQHAEKKIEKLKKLNLSSKELKYKVEKAGGTSVVGAIFGTLILVSTVMLPIVEHSSATNRAENKAPISNAESVALPRCNNAEVQEAAKDLLTGILSKSGIDESEVKVYDFKQVDYQSKSAMNVCSYVAEIESEPKTFYYYIKWIDHERGLLNVRAGRKAKNIFLSSLHE